MNWNLCRLIWITYLLGSLTATAIAQKPSPAGGLGGQQAGQGAQAAQGGGAAAGLLGLSYSPDEWPNLRLPDVKGAAPTYKEGRAVVCYRLVPTNSGTQPFVLEPISKYEIQGTGFDRPCGDVGDAESDSVGQKTCASEQKKATEEEHLEDKAAQEWKRNHTEDAKKINSKTKPLDSTHWSPCSDLKDSKDPILMNQTLVVGVDISALGEVGVNIDQLKLLNINVTNQQGSSLNPSPIRPSFPSTASSGGGGGSAGSPGAVDDNSGKGNWWIPIGSHAPAGRYPIRWDPNHKGRSGNYGYDAGDIVTDATGTHFFMANHTWLQTKPSPVPVDPFPPQPRTERILDGNVVWQELDRSVANQGVESVHWTPLTPYQKGALVCVERNENDGTESPGILQNNLQMTIGSVIGTNVLSEAILNNLPSLKSSVPSQIVSGYISPRERPEAQKPCIEIPLSPGMHLHYYFAVTGGTSGTAPSDPLSLRMIPRAIYLAWPYQLPPDIIPTFNVNLVYSPPMPGAPWQGNTFYPAGSVVTTSTNSGHYFTALTGGVSIDEPNEPDLPANLPPPVGDGSLTWLDSGTGAPSVPAASGAGGGGSGQAPSGGGGGGGAGSATGKAQVWLPRTHYLLGDLVIDPAHGHYFTMVNSSKGLSGPGTAVQGGGGLKDPFPPISFTSTLADGDLVWLQEAGAASTRIPEWTSGHHWLYDEFRIGTIAYRMTSSTAVEGNPAPDPFKATNVVVTFPDNNLEWSDCASAGGARVSGCNSLAPPDMWKASNLYSLHQTVTGANRHKYYVSTVTGPNPGQASNTVPLPLPNPNYPANVVYDGDIIWYRSGPAPAQLPSWQPGITYSTNQSVNVSGQLYVMVGTAAGDSSTTKPIIANGAGQPTTVIDGDLLWMDTNQHQNGCTANWKPGYAYQIDDRVYSSSCEQYQMIRFTAGTSGEDEPPFRILEASMQIEPQTTVGDSSDLSWKDVGVVRPVGVAAGIPPSWQSGVLYKYGSLIFVPGPGSGHYYVAIGPNASGTGQAGVSSPFIKVAPPFPITWQDSGTTAPASIASGQPADQTVSLINLALPQSHSLSYFNIAAGVGVDFKRPPIFNFVSASSYVNTYKGTLPTGYVAAPGGISIAPTSTAYGVDSTTGCTITVPYVAPTTPPAAMNPNLAYECPTQTGKNARPVDPLLVLTLYIPPVDAERPMRLIPKFNHGFGGFRDFIPAPSFGLSLSNPTTNFYLGASNEAVIRNVQAFYGLALHNIPMSLTPGSSQPLYGGAGTPPTVGTVSKFQKGFFLGVTFNLSGFVQSLFGGGGGGAAK